MLWFVNNVPFCQVHFLLSTHLPRPQYSVVLASLAQRKVYFQKADFFPLGFSKQEARNTPIISFPFEWREFKTKDVVLKARLYCYRRLNIKD